MRTLLAIVVVLAATFAVPSTHAQEAGSDRAKTLQSQLSSPFCPGKTLDGCTSPAAAEWRQDIRTWVDEGVSSQEIKRRLSERAGGEDLIAAPSSGFSNGWLLFATLGSVLILAFAVRRIFTRQGGEPDLEPVDEEKIDKKYDQRLDDELALLD